jgi:hypothetical protein
MLGNTNGNELIDICITKFKYITPTPDANIERSIICDLFRFLNQYPNKSIDADILQLYKTHLLNIPALDLIKIIDTKNKSQTDIINDIVNIYIAENYKSLNNKSNNLIDVIHNDSPIDDYSKITKNHDDKTTNYNREENYKFAIKICENLEVD